MIRQTTEGVWIIDSDSHVSQWVIQNHRLDHDRATLPAIEKYIPKGGVVVDGGANIGSHAVFYLRCVGPEGTVIAFEPNHEAYHCLLNNCPGAVCHQLALGSRYGIFRIVHDKNYGGAYLVSGKEQSGYPVITVPLDEFGLKRLDFLKLDVEGFEVLALRGAESTIARCRPVMLIEVNEGALARQGFTQADLYQEIESLGYRHEFLFPSHHVNMPQTDVICFPK